MLSSTFFNTLLAGTLQRGDFIGFTFFTGYMAMLAATVFFLFERQRVSEKWKLSLLVSALITGIAGVHYFYMRGVWLETGSSPTEYRYIDWTLTVPLMCVEFYLLLRPYGAKASLMWQLILGAVVMLVTGYIGEALDVQNNILWGVISTLGWGVIVYHIFFGTVAKLSAASNDPNVQGAVTLLKRFVLVGWAIYPIGYMLLPGNLLSGVGISATTMDLLYNIGDAVNKIGFGLVVYTMAVKATDAKAGLSVA
jgi:sensory rhodopsin